MKRALLFLLLITLLGSFLRLNKLTDSPPALYIDEADAGFQAYSFLKTGQDYFGNFLPVHFQSFADNRTPLYIYSVIPGVAVLGLNSLAVRLPAAIFGILTIPLLFWLVRHLRPEESEAKKDMAGLAAAFLLAVLPWHIHFSRMAFEATLLLFLLVLAIGFLVKWVDKPKSVYLNLFLIFTLLTPYVYSTAKLFIPLLLLSLLIILRKRLPKPSSPAFVFGLVLAGLLIFPMARDVLSGTGRERFSILSVFSDVNNSASYMHYQWFTTYAASYFPLEFFHPQTLAKLFIGQAANLFYLITNYYLAAFSPNFLIFAGDPNLRHSIPVSGVAGFSITALFVIGLVKMIRAPLDFSKKLTLTLLLLSPLPAIITRDGQYHATRLFLLVLPLTLIAVEGFLALLSKLKFKSYYPLLFLVAAIFVWEIGRDQFLRMSLYPQTSYEAFDGGWQEIVSKTSSLAKNYDEVIIDASDGTPWQTLFAFYGKLDPKTFQQFAQNPDTTLTALKMPVKKYYPGNISFASADPTMLDRTLPKKVLMIVPRLRIDLSQAINVELVDSIQSPNKDILYYFITNKLLTP